MTSYGDPAPVRRITLDWAATLIAILILCATGIPRIFSTPLSTDEGYTATAIENLNEVLTSTHFTMSGYYTVLWVWSRAGTSIEWLRTLSLLAAIGTILCVRKVGLVIGGRSLAATSVIILPLLAMFQWKATEARAYSIEILVVSLAWLIILSGKTEQRTGAWRWWVILGVLGAYGETLHGLFFIQYIGIAVFVALRQSGRRASGQALVLAAVPTGVAAIFWATGAEGVGTYMTGGPDGWIGAFLDTYFGHAPLIVTALFVGTALWVLFLVRSAVRGRAWASNLRIWAPVIWTFGPLVVLAALSLLVNRFNPKYLAPLLPGLAILFGQVGTLPGRWPRRRTMPSQSMPRTARRRAARTGGPLVVISLVLLGGLTTPAFVPTPWRQVTNLVATGPTSGNCVIFAEVTHDIPEQVRPPFEVAWHEYQSVPSPTVISSNRALERPRRFDEPMPLDQVVSRAAECESIWIVATLAYGVDPMAGYLTAPAIKQNFTIDRSWNWPDDYRLTLLRRR